METLLSLEYPPNLESIPLDLSYMEKRSAGIGTARFTPLQFLLTRCSEALTSDGTRLSIVKLLLDSGASVANIVPSSIGTGHIIPNTTLLSYCAQHESAAIVRLLLQHGAGASANAYDNAGWLPIDYAILRQDREVLAAFNDYDSSSFTLSVSGWNAPSHDPSHFKDTYLPCNTILSAFGHPAIAILLARSGNHRMIFLEGEHQAWEHKVEREVSRITERQPAD